METKISLLSKERLRSYDYDISKHYENLKLVGKITPKIATLEIILRNKLDQKLSEYNRHWIEESNDENVINAREKIAQRTHSKSLTPPISFENESRKCHLSHQRKQNTKLYDESRYY